MAVLSKRTKGINHENAMHLTGYLLLLISLGPVFAIVGQGTVNINFVDMEKTGSMELINSHGTSIKLPETDVKDLIELQFTILTPEQNSAETIIDLGHLEYNLLLKRSKLNEQKSIELILNKIHQKGLVRLSKEIHNKTFQILEDLNLKICFISDEIMNIQESSADDFCETFEPIIIEDTTEELKQFEKELEAELTNFAAFEEIEDGWKLV